jgi:hypothetical protein
MKDSNGDQFIDPSFSHYPCDLKNSKHCHLGGDRYKVVGYEDIEANKPLELKVCTDCYVKLCT